ncbi:MAG: DUF2520 domain-containing protein [Balneolales bacterium]|nr:DUF2520 domain-containing protein [Balneolales bacterium]
MPKSPVVDSGTEIITCVIVGSGRVARSLAAAIYGLGSGSGFSLRGVFARNALEKTELRDLLWFSHLSGLDSLKVSAGELVFLAVSDDAIAQVSCQLSRYVSPGDSPAFFAHCSGAAGLDVMDDLRKKGAGVCAFHPLQTFREQPDPQVFSNITVSLLQDNSEAGKICFTHLQRLSKALGAKPLEVNLSEKKQLHLAAVFAANYFVTLMHLVQRAAPALVNKGVDPLRLLWPLVQKSVENTAAEGPFRALTGPVSRNDKQTITAHLGLLQEENDPGMAQIYQLLGQFASELAVEDGRYTDAEADELRKLLKSNSNNNA